MKANRPSFFVGEGGAEALGLNGRGATGLPERGLLIKGRRRRKITIMEAIMAIHRWIG